MVMVSDVGADCDKPNAGARSAVPNARSTSEQFTRLGRYLPYFLYQRFVPLALGWYTRFGRTISRWRVFPYSLQEDLS